MKDFLNRILMAKDDGAGGGGGGKDDADDSSDADESEDGEGADGDGEEGDENADDAEDEEDESDPTDKDTGLKKSQLKEAGELYKLLTDENTRKNTLEILAKKAGLLGTQETQKEVKDDAKTLIQMLEEGLGPELKWLAAKLAPAMEKILESERGSTKQTLTEMKQNQVTREVDAVYAALRSETKGLSKKFEPAMVKLADQLHPAPGMSVDAYVRLLYKTASADSSSKSHSQKLAERINRNSKDAPGRIQDSSAPGSGKRADPNARVSIKDAVRQAAAKMGYKGD